MDYIAHVKRGKDGNWAPPHPLEQHLLAVGELAAEFATSFSGANWAHLAGLWHDLGKYRSRFQNYIRQASGYEPDAHIKGEAGKAPHSTAGALLACDRFGPAGRVLAYLIAGHHAGLYDWNSAHDSLEYRLAQQASRTELEEAIAAIPSPTLLDSSGFDTSLKVVPGGPAGFALWVRILFSCLVDADFLDTERYMAPERFELRDSLPKLQELLPVFDQYMADLSAKAPPSEVNRLRAAILGQCQAKAMEAPGLFSLTVPTGGGKTLSSMAFALEHAKAHGKRRIIYVIPYTSIIEQTADIFRGIFGEAVIEHHSNAEADPEQETSQSRLACENWDAPIVVTTNVQFFESLFAAKTSRCRKLHNIVDSIVVLDEAQLLPTEFLQPILDVLKLLAKHYGVSVVLSTATQPALASQEYFDARRSRRGLDDVREIIADPDGLYRRLKRVQCRLPADWHVPTPWPELAADISRHDGVLAIVNTRRHARELHALMPEGTLHLSALMCGAHRSQVIADIKARLKAGTPTRVVSTQLVEAGVDVDFPVVYRALAGLDSIAQAAGRCNREGRQETGEVVVFVPPPAKLPDLIKHGLNAAISTLHGNDGDPLERKLFARYFEHLYQACDLDKHGIHKTARGPGLLDVDSRTLAVNFRTAAEKFRLIDDQDSAPVVCLYRGPEGSDNMVDTLIATLRKGGPERWLMRKLQRYTVNIPRRDALRLMGQGDVEEVTPGLFVQINSLLYHPILGFLPEGGPLDTTGLVV